MYEAYYGLRKNPFALTPDPEFLFMTDTHRDAIAGLTYSILGRKGFCVLTGDAGTGKTTLLRSVMASIPASQAQFSVILNPAVTTSEFMEMMLADFGIKEILPSKAQRLARLQQFLLDCYREGKVAVLVVDEAHRLSVDLLEEIRLLANFETDQEKLLQIVLAGQDELGEMLDRIDLRQLKQRIAVRFAIQPLSSAAVGAYMRHRWEKTSERDLPFTPDAILQISHFSSGIPRVVNAVCDNALLLGFAEETKWIQKDHIAEVAADLHLAPARSSHPTNTQRSAVASQAGLNGAAEPRNGVKADAERQMQLRIPRPVETAYEEGPLPTPDRYLSAKHWRTRLGTMFGA